MRLPPRGSLPGGVRTLFPEPPAGAERAGRVMPRSLSARAVVVLYVLLCVLAILSAAHGSVR